MDLISRQAAIDAILHNEELYSNNFGNDPIDRYTVAIIDNDAQTLAQLPTIDPVRWIPITERLPEVGRNVLLSVGKGLYTAEGNLKDDGTWVQYRWSANIDHVDAWAEMPSPYREVK